MSLPIYILAGQSNAVSFQSILETTLTDRYGASGVHLVTVASGGAPLLYERARADDWATLTELPRTLVDETKAALASVPDGELRGLFWLHGESDSQSFANSADYDEAFAALFDHFQAEVPEAANVSISVFSLSSMARGRNDRDNWDVLMEAQQRLAAQDADVHLLSPDAIAHAAGLSRPEVFRDALHYSTAMKKLLALEGLDQLITAYATMDRDASGVPSPGGDVFGPDGRASTMAGGLGSDTYFIDDRDDRVLELRNEGNDCVVSSISYSLWMRGDHVEMLSLTGRKNLSGTGNALDNTMTGNDGANHLRGRGGDDILLGGAGNDWLIGQAGNDHMAGGAGNDQYVVHDTGDVIVEKAGQGTDWVRSWVSFALRDHGQDIERLRLVGPEDLAGMGNSQNNWIAGNAGNNRLNGAWGNDRLFGGPGNDRLSDDHGNDMYKGGYGRDKFVFKRDAGNDWVRDFTPGEDKLVFHGLNGVDDLNLTTERDRTVIYFGDGSRVKLDNIEIGTLQEEDFIFL